MALFIALIIFSIAALVTRKYGFASLLIFTAPIHRLFVDVGFALKPFYMVVFAAIFIVLGARAKGSKFSTDKIFKVVLFFLISIFISTAMNGSHTVSFRHVVVLIFVFSGSYLLYRQIKTYADIIILKNAYLAAGLLLGLSGLWFYSLYYLRPDLCVEGSAYNGVLYDLERYWTWPSLQSVDVGPNAYAMNLIPFIFVAVGGVATARSLVAKAYSGFILLLLCINLFLTFSRGGLISVVLVAGLIVLLSNRRKVVKMAYVFSLVIIIPFITRYAGDFYLAYSTMKGAYSGVGSDLTSSRGELILSSLAVYQSSPIFGIGQGVISDPEYVGKQSHNTYVELLAENGILPFVLFSVILWMLVRRMQYIRSEAQKNSKLQFTLYFVFGMLGLLIAAIPTSAITMTLLWGHMAVIVGIYNVIRYAEIPSSAGNSGSKQLPLAAAQVKP